MGRKRARYKVRIEVEALTLSELDSIYKELQRLTVQVKDSLKVEVEDTVGGTHNIYEETGVMPTGEKCQKCIRLTCIDCPKYLLDGNE